MFSAIFQLFYFLTRIIFDIFIIDIVDTCHYYTVCCYFQTLILTFLMRYLGHKTSIMFGLVFEIAQLFCYGFGSQTW
jgi:hypothetical protein